MLVYIDLNMIRAGVVNHPSEWPFGGCREIQKPRQRYALIDYQRLKSLLGVSSYDQLKDAHRKWVKESLSKMNGRERVWTESIAVGNRHFVEETKTRLGFRARSRASREAAGVYELRDSNGDYSSDSGLQKKALKTPILGTCIPQKQPVSLVRPRGLISGPLLDRIDIHVEVPALNYQDLANINQGESSEEIRSGSMRHVGGRRNVSNRSPFIVMPR